MPKSAGDTSGDTLLFWFRETVYVEKTEGKGRLGARSEIMVATSGGFALGLMVS